MSADDPAPNGIAVDVGLGEVVDRLTILRIKAERARDPEVRKTSAERAAMLSAAVPPQTKEAAALQSLREQALHEINSALWDAEDTIRARIAAGDFGPAFQQVACRIPELNDERARIRAELDDLSGWGWAEHKSYDDAAEKPQERAKAPSIVSCAFGRMLVPPGDIYVGQSLIRYGTYSPDECALLGAMIDEGDTIVDAGAHIGALTVPMAQKAGAAGRVYAFEPQRVLFQILCGNLALNGIRNCEAWPVGLGSAVDEMTVPPVDYDTEGNYGALALAREGPGERVPVTTIDMLGLPDCRLIKADVQGMEAATVEGARDTITRCSPVLYVENDQPDAAPHLVETLFALGYDCYWHLPRLFASDNFRGESEDIFPGVISVNLLCLPRGEAPCRPDLRRVTSPDDWWTR